MYLDGSAVMYLYDVNFITSITTVQTATVVLFAGYYNWCPIIIQSVYKQLVINH